MSNQLDTKLDYILNPAPDTASGQSIKFATNPKTIEAIKQAFIDEGWLSPEQYKELRKSTNDLVEQSSKLLGIRVKGIN